MASLQTAHAGTPAFKSPRTLNILLQRHSGFSSTQETSEPPETRARWRSSSERSCAFRFCALLEFADSNWSLYSRHSAPSSSYSLLSQISLISTYKASSSSRKPTNSQVRKIWPNSRKWISTFVTRHSAFSLPSFANPRSFASATEETIARGRCVGRDRIQKMISRKIVGLFGGTERGGSACMLLAI